MAQDNSPHSAGHRAQLPPKIRKDKQFPKAAVFMLVIAASVSLLLLIKILTLKEYSSVYALWLSIALLFLAMLAIFRHRQEGKFYLAFERFRLALETAGAGMWDLDIQTGAGSQIGNHRVLFGNTSKSATLENFLESVHPEDRDRVCQSLESAKLERKKFSMEFRLSFPDGSPQWVHARGKFLYSKSGTPERIIGITTDINRGRRTEEALQKSKQEFSLAFEAAHLGWWVWSEETGQIIASEGTKTILGLRSQSKVSLRAFMETIHPEDRDRAYQSWRHALDSRTYWLIEYRVLHSDGTTRWVESRGRTFGAPDSHFVQVVGVAMDITDRKHAEEQMRSFSGRLIEAQEEERIRLARELHDDICQRLAILEIELGSVKAQPELQNPELQQRLDHLVWRAREIGSDVQALSHELHSSKLEILGLATAMKSFCAEFASQHTVDIEFSSYVPFPLSKEISICLYRILQEALHNAFKHSGERRFIVQLQGEPDAVELTVRDFGIGFDPERALQGHGLGLISMRERVNVLNGTLAIESQAGRGAQIRARVPVDGIRSLRCA